MNTNKGNVAGIVNIILGITMIINICFLMLVADPTIEYVAVSLLSVVLYCCIIQKVLENKVKEENIKVHNKYKRVTKKYNQLIDKTEKQIYIYQSLKLRYENKFDIENNKLSVCLDFNLLKDLTKFDEELYEIISSFPKTTKHTGYQNFKDINKIIEVI